MVENGFKIVGNTEKKKNKQHLDFLSLFVVVP